MNLRVKAELVIQVVIFYSIGSYLVELENSGAEHLTFFLWSERVVATIFTAEYLIRWARAEDKRRYPARLMAIVDLLAVLPFYLTFLVDLRSLRLLRTLRLLRLLKFYRYNEAVQTLVASFARVRWQLQVMGFAVGLVTMVSSLLIYECERDAQPIAFARFSDALWWSFATLTTVGYGDKFPITGAGRLVAVGSALAGLGIFGTFVSLVGGAFVATLQEKRDAASRGLSPSGDVQEATTKEGNSE